MKKHILNNTGAVLLTVVILIVVIGLTGVAIYSLTTTSTFSQLSSQNASQAFYLAESGFRVVAEEYNYENDAAGTPANEKNIILENLHNTTLTLPSNAGQFAIRLYPYWFYVNNAYVNGEATISVKMPGGIPLRNPSHPGSPMISIPDTGSLKLRGKTRHAVITNSSVSGDVITFTLDTSVPPFGFPYDIQAGEELFLVYEDNTTPSQTITQNAGMTLPGSNTIAQILPAQNGSFRIYNENNDKMDYTYKKRLPAVIDPGSPPATVTLTQVDHQNSADASVFPFDIGNTTEFYLGKNLAVYSTSTFGQGSMAGSKTVGNYTDVGLDAGFSTGKETISFEDDIQDFSPKMGETGGPEIPEGDANAPIEVHEDTKQVELGKNLQNRYGSIWYAGDTDIANCIEGRCSLGKGFRAFFEFQFDNADTDTDSEDYGDGFTFSIISGENNDYTDTGSGGEYLGYAGPGLDDGLQSPKIGVEFDTYPNTGAGDICESDSRRDDTPVANHAALVYWGEDTPGSFDATGGYLSLGSANFGSPTAREGTISFWFKRDIIYDGNGSSTGDRLWGQNANMEIRFSSDGDDIILDWGGLDSLTYYNHPFTQEGEWYFLAITWNENSNNLILYWGTETIGPASLVSSGSWSSSVSSVGVAENLFLNSSGGDAGKNFHVNGNGSDLRYFTAQRNLGQLQADYNVRLNGTESNLRAYFPLQTDLLNLGPANITATVKNNAKETGWEDAGWSADAPEAYACSATYDDNRHGTGGITALLNSLNTNDASGNDGYHQVTKAAGDPNWLEDGLLHQARIEIIRPLEPSIDGVTGGGATDFEYQIKIWIDCPVCSPEDLVRFEDVKASFTDALPLIQKTIASGNQLILNPTLHDELKKILFGFTQGTSDVASQNITLSNFEIYFLKRYPVADLATW